MQASNQANNFATSKKDLVFVTAWLCCAEKELDGRNDPKNKMGLKSVSVAFLTTKAKHAEIN